MSHLYIRCLTKKYCAAVIFFDGYNGNPTTKDATHLRTGDCVRATVLFARVMMIKSNRSVESIVIEIKFYSILKKSKRDAFLYSKANKQHHMHYLSDNLERAGCVLYRANDDADVLIFLKA